MIKTCGCFTILTTENKILLLKRKDYPLWDLPGGRIEKHESPIECAIRETYEETGYKTNISYLVGTYNRPKFSDKQYIYHGIITGGSPIISGPETSCLKWFNIDCLPLNLVPNRRKQIKHYKYNHKDLKKTLKDNHILFLILNIKKRFF